MVLKNSLASDFMISATRGLLEAGGPAGLLQAEVKKSAAEHTAARHHRGQQEENRGSKVFIMVECQFGSRTETFGQWLRCVNQKDGKPADSNGLIRVAL